MLSKKYIVIIVTTLLITVACNIFFSVSGDAPNTLYYLHRNNDNHLFDSPQEMWPIDDNYMIVVALSSKYLTIVDISDPENNISVVSSIYVGGTQPRKCDVSDDKNFIFLSNGDNLSIINITDINNPTVEGYVNLGGISYLIGVSYVDTTGYAFCTDYGNDASGWLLRSFNCVDKTNPTYVSSIACGKKPHGVWANETVAFCLGHAADNVITYDISNPAAMSQLNSYSSGNLHRCAQIWGEYAPNIYVAGLDNGAWIFNISNPSNIVMKSFTAFGSAQTCNVIPNANETIMYVNIRDTDAHNSRLYVYNIVDKTNPVQIDMIQGTDAGVTLEACLAGGMVVNSNYIFCGDGDPADGGTDHKAVVVFRFGEEIPDPPGPEDEISFTKINDGTNNSADQNVTPLINWTKMGNTSNYQLQISNDSGFTDIVVNLSDINEENYPTRYSEDATIVSFLLPSEYALPCIQYYFYRIKAYSVEE